MLYNAVTLNADVKIMFVPKGLDLVFYVGCSGKVHDHVRKKSNENYAYSVYVMVDVCGNNHYIYVVCSYLIIYVM